MDYEFCKAFHKLFDSEIEILDIVMQGKKEITISKLADELDKDISNLKKTILSMEKANLIVCTRQTKCKKYNPIIAIELSNTWENAVRNLTR